MATPAEELLLRHPGDRVLVVPKAKAALARELEVSGFARLSVARTGSISITLTEAGLRRREELQLDSIGRASPASAAPKRGGGRSKGPPTKPAPPAPSPRKAAAPTKRTPSLDDLFGQGAFHPGTDDQRPVTLADLRAFEERLVAQIRQIVDEALATRTPRNG